MTHEFDNYKLSGFFFSFCDISMSLGLISTFMASPIRITTSSVDVYAPSGTPKISNEFLRDYCSTSPCFLSNLFISSI